MNELELVKKGFNAGYLLNKYDPTLAVKIRTSLADQNHPYALGYVAGMKEYKREQLLGRHKLMAPKKDKSKDLEMDM